MTLDDKRKVIEALLCCGDPESPDATPQVSESLGLGRRLRAAAYQAFARAHKDDPMGWDRVGLSTPYTEAAYRLIESSPTMRREWFGAR